MLCREVLGNINDPSAVIALRRRLGGDFSVDPVDLEWPQVRERVLDARSAAGRAVEVRLPAKAADRGLSDGDVLACMLAGEAGGPCGVVVAVRLLSARCLVVSCDPAVPGALARASWEVGNAHVPLFAGDDAHELVAPWNGTLERVLRGVPGVSLGCGERALDPARRLSSNGLTTVVRLAADLKVTVRR